MEPGKEEVAAAPPPVQRYMVVERFNDAPAIYRRLRERGRMMPEGVIYVSSWIDETFRLCFQLMESPGLRPLEEWMANWSDLMSFEIYPVIASAEAVEKMARVDEKRGS